MTDIPHFVREAAWIWPNNQLYLHNCYARFRYEFTQETLPAAVAPLWLTADQSYRLYVNGQYVCRGPARGFQACWPIDEVDILPYLRTGRNLIAVEAYNPGMGLFYYIHCTCAGFLCAASWNNGTVIRSGSDAWQMSRAHAYRTQTAHLSAQMGFQEDFAAALDDDSWKSSPDLPEDFFANCAAWETAKRFREFCFGRPPYWDVEPRQLPLLQESVRAPACLVAAASGPCSANYRHATNFQDEFYVHERLGLSPQAIPEFSVSDTALEFFAAPTGNERLGCFSVDLGPQWLPGTLHIEVKGALGREIIDVIYRKKLEPDWSDLCPPGVGSMIALASRLRLRQGVTSHDFYHIMGVRGFSLLIRESVVPLQITVSWRSSCYPLAQEGNFACSDQNLDDIWRICEHTQRTCALDAYVDTPWREQAQWLGDARIQAINSLRLDWDLRLFERCIRQIARQEVPFGLTPGHAPTRSNNSILPDFTLTWMQTFWDHWLYTGTPALFDEHYDRIMRALAYFEAPERYDERGLLTFDSRMWLFEDWCDLPKERTPAFYNLLYIMTLEKLAELASASGRMASAAHFTSRATTLRKRAVMAFVDQESGLILPALDKNGHPYGSPSVHDQVLAVLIDLCPELRPAMTAKRIRPCLMGQAGEWAETSAFWAHYLLAAAEKLDLRLEALAYIRSKWSPMIADGTTWEVFDMTNRSIAWSLCHAWSSHPLAHIPDLLCGLRQTAPGWREAEFRPWVPEEIDHAAVRIPTPWGCLTGGWRRSDDSVEFYVTPPQGLALTIALPGQPEVKTNQHYAQRIDLRKQRGLTAERRDANQLVCPNDRASPVIAQQPKR